MRMYVPNKREWYECRQCGFAYDWFDMKFIASRSPTRRMKDYYVCSYLCRDCFSIKNTKRIFKYRHTDSGFKSFIKSALKQRKRKEYKLKMQARMKLAYAIRIGKVKRMPCQVCGIIKVDGHHSDYNQPLDVEWLCRKHHWRYEHGRIEIKGL